MAKFRMESIIAQDAVATDVVMEFTNKSIN